MNAKTQPPSLRDRVTKLTQKLVDEIEKAAKSGSPLPWRKPWACLSALSGKGRPYKGLNQLLLSCASYKDQRWYTMNLANELGGQVRKGEKGTQVYFWKITTRTPEAEPGSDVEAQRSFILRTYYVWNYEQIEWKTGEPPAFAKLRQVSEGGSAQPLIDTLVAFGVPVEHGGDRACYIPSQDRINMPARGAFDSDEKYAAVLAHEVAHSTGHSKRLDRNLGGRFGSEAYAMEELVAEMAGAMLCAQAGLASGDLDSQHASYLKSWLDCLRRDPYALFAVSRMAQAACEMVAGPAAAEGDADEEKAAA